MSTTVCQTISCEELQGETSSGAAIDVIDVRTPVEFREVHCTHARNAPLDSLNPEAVKADRAGAEQPLYVICKSGARAEKACAAFIAAGFTNVVNVEGGTQAWAAAGLPVVRGKKAVSLERQVRMAAGSHWFGSRLLWTGLLDRSGGVCRSGACLRRDHRHLRDGHAARKDAVEPGQRRHHGCSGL
jgi:rhodanese-related sulfurtransferase